jgi:CRISPR-associated protein Csb2
LRITDGLARQTPDTATKASAALRRAVLCRYQNTAPHRPLPPLVSGHQADGSPARDPRQLAFACDIERGLLLITSSADRADRTSARVFATLDKALAGFRTLRAGAAGRLSVEAVNLPQDDTLLRPSSIWRSATPYHVNRHRRLGDLTEAVREDVRESCAAAGLPPPRIEVLRAWSEGQRGIAANLQLTFARAVSVPVQLGRSRFKGGGLFVAVADG